MTLKSELPKLSVILGSDAHSLHLFRELTLLPSFLYRFGTRRIKANQVYQEYIQERHHLHMNATKWLSLTDFIKHLGREGIVKVEENETGWFISWIDNSPAALAKQDQLRKMEREKESDGVRERKRMEEMIRKAREEKEERERKAGEDSGEKKEGLNRAEGEKVKLGFSFKKKEDGAKLGSTNSEGSIVAETSASGPTSTAAPAASSASASTSASTSTTSTSMPLKLGTNPLKASNPLTPSTSNPLKSNPLKPNPLKSSNSLKSGSASSSSPSARTAAERIMADEQERKRKASAMGPVPSAGVKRGKW